MFCRGQELNVLTYPALYACIGNKYGGSTGISFKLPDARGRVLVGANYGDFRVNDLRETFVGSSFGSEKVTVEKQNLPACKLSGVTKEGNAKFHVSVNAMGLESERNHAVGVTGGPAEQHNDTSYPNSNHTHNLETEVMGQGVPLNNCQPSLGVNYIIKFE